MSVAIVVTGGSPPDPSVLQHLGRADHVVCADSGFDHALALGIEVDLLVGDLDSVSSAGRAIAESRGVEIVAASPDKDLTDTELALVAAASRGATSITLVSGGGDRLDHLLGIMAALAHDGLVGLERIDAWIGRDRLVVVRPDRPVVLDLDPGALVSLIPLSGPVHGVRTSGLQWPLDGETLRADRARGVSNRSVAGDASVAVESGVLAVIVPGALDFPVRTHQSGDPS
jgi:thiamine pyrophosphokinase